MRVRELEKTRLLGKVQIERGVAREDPDVRLLVVDAQDRELDRKSVV